MYVYFNLRLAVTCENYLGKSIVTVPKFWFVFDKDMCRTTVQSCAVFDKKSERQNLSYCQENSWLVFSVLSSSIALIHVFVMPGWVPWSLLFVFVSIGEALFSVFRMSVSCPVHRSFYSLFGANVSEFTTFFKF